MLHLEEFGGWEDRGGPGYNVTFRPSFSKGRVAGGDLGKETDRRKPEMILVRNRLRP